MEEIESAVPATTNRQGVYPWQDWADGKLRMAVRGVDFDCQPFSFAAGARQWGNRRGYRTEVAERGDKVYFAFRGEPLPEPIEAMHTFVEGTVMGDPGGFLSRADLWAGWLAYAAQWSPGGIGTRAELYGVMRGEYFEAVRGRAAGFAGAQL